MQIDDILKYAEIIGKEPDKPQSQKNINNMKIAMRYAIRQAAKIRSDEEIKIASNYHAMAVRLLSDFPHDYESEISGFISGYKQALKDIKEL